MGFTLLTVVRLCFQFYYSSLTQNLMNFDVIHSEICLYWGTFGLAAGEAPVTTAGMYQNISDKLNNRFSELTQRNKR